MLLISNIIMLFLLPQHPTKEAGVFPHRVGNKLVDEMIINTGVASRQINQVPTPPIRS